MAVARRIAHCPHRTDKWNAVANDLGPNLNTHGTSVAYREGLEVLALMTMMSFNYKFGRLVGAVKFQVLINQWNELVHLILRYTGYESSLLPPDHPVGLSPLIDHFSSFPNIGMCGQHPTSVHGAMVLE